MSVNPDINDKAYQFFIEEAAELLQIIEDGILELRRDRGANTVHAVMRAAHSIKGGAASVELEAIKTISHRMETAFRALYDETVEIDDELEGLLLDGFDCLKDPLGEQIETGSHDPEAALANAIPVLEALEANLGADALKQADSFIPSSSDLGIDMVTSIFEMDVEEGIAHLEEVAANPGNFPVLGELQAQAEVFVGFGELLDLPGFGAIGQTILDACHNNPADPVGLLTIALQDLHAAKELVMGGDRDQGGAPSEALLALAGGGSGAAAESNAPEAGLSAGDFADFGLSEADLANFDFGNGDFANADLSALSLDPATADSNAPEASSLDDGLTDAGLGDLDLAALTMEGESLLNDADSTSDVSSDETNDETPGLDLGAADFQALVDESSSLDLNGPEDEFATVEQGGMASAAGSLEDPAFAELEANQDDAAAFDSLDAMAQLANLMAEPETNDAPAAGDEAGFTADAALEESADFDFALDGDIASESSPELEADVAFELEPNKLESEHLETASSENISDGDDIFAALPEDTEAASNDALATEIPAQNSETNPADIAAPDAELENMWAELSDDLGDGSGNMMDAAEDSDLDSAFDIAMDQASEAPEEQMEPSPGGDDLADLFANDENIAPEEQDVTTALSVAEADAAFEAMVDASTAENSDVVLDPESSLNLSFDDEELSSPETSSSPDLQDIFALDLPNEEAANAEPAIEEDASTTSQGEEELVDPWSSLITEDSDPPEQANVDALGDAPESETVETDDSEEDNSPAMDESLAELFQSNEDATASAEASAEATAEFVDEATVAQGMEMGTFVQASEVMPLSDESRSSSADEWPNSEESGNSEQDNIPEDAAFLESAQPDESASDESNDLGFDPLEAGTFIQNLNDGTFLQSMDVSPGSALDSASSEADEPAEATESTSAESFDEGTFVQAFEEGTFIQGAAIADLSEAAVLEQSPGVEENFDEGTFVQGIDEGTFIQGITDAAQAPAEQENQANPEPDDEWSSSAPEDDSGESDESLIPELQAFIAQAAAESANSTVDAKDSETVETGETEPEVTEPQAEQSETVEQALASQEESETGAMEPVASLSELPGLGDESSPATDSLEAEAIAEPTKPETSELDEPADKQAPQQDGEQELPSLESMFSVAPERMAEIANDSLTSELMAGTDLEAIQSIQNGDQPAGESTPEVTTEEAVNLEEAASEESEAATPEAIAQPEAITHTPTAVEVALAEHQAVEPIVTTNPVSQAKTERINNAVLAVEQMFGQLPTNNQLPATKPTPTTEAAQAESKENAKAAKKKRQQGTKLSGISVRVDLSVLERMNNLVGELVLSRNSLSLQHEQLQSVVTQLDKRFNNFEGQLNGLRGISDQMLVEPAQRQAQGQSAATQSAPSATSEEASTEEGSLLEGFDVLEMDRYSALHGQLQEIFEQLMQLEEGVDDIGVLLEQSTQSLTQQRQRLGLLQNELMWARMLPLDNILGRFPRVLRDMARKHGKSVDLNMNGTSVLVDKGMLEKLHDPMLHLLRNAFDHGIEKAEERKSQGKSDRGEIQINAYYQGNQTVIEIKDDGQGVNLERIAKRAVELEWLSREEIKSVPQQALLDLIFEPGFTTAAKLSELSGRGVGLDVVREQIKGLKGSVTVDFEKGKGTTFTLRLPLTLTVAKLMVCQVGTTAIALPSDGIEDLLVPQPEQLKMVGNKRLLHWRDDLIPIQSMTELLDYSCPTADIASLKAITSKSIPVPKDWALPLLIFSRGSQRCAMEVNRLLMEQELVIKPFSSAMTPPEYSYGCTILGDGRMIPVLDGTALLQQLSDNSMAIAAGVELSDETLDGESSDGVEIAATMAQAMQADTILVVDDSTAMRRTMALSLEKAGYRVLQAGDGQEALTQLRQSSAIQLVICDVEMPNMNGFEFLSQRRREPVLMKIPVVMLTSRSSDKHRRLAMQLKAHDYFSKPYVEQDFLKSIKKILASQAAAAKV